MFNPFKREGKQLKKKLRLLNNLSNLQEFKVWREMVADPKIKEIEDDLYKNMDKTPEPVLRAKLKHLNSIKYLFYEVFEEVKGNLEALKKD